MGEVMKVSVATVLLPADDDADGLPGQPANGVPPDALLGADANATWADRPKVEVEAFAGETYGDVATRAAEQFGLPSIDHWPQVRMVGALGEPISIGIDLYADGSINWLHPDELLTLAGLSQLRTRGLADAEPNKMFIVVNDRVPGVGNGHDAFLELWRILSYYWPYVATLWTAVDMGRSLKSALGVLRNQLPLTHTVDFPRLARVFHTPKTTEEARILLGMDEAMVCAFLPFLGLEDDGGYWRPRHDVKADELREWQEVLAVLTEWTLSPEQLRGALTKIVEIEPGQRAKRARGIVTSVAMASDQWSLTDNYPVRLELVTPSVVHVHVLRDDRYSYSELIGQVAIDDEMGTYALLPTRNFILDSTGLKKKFDSIDAAADALRAAHLDSQGH